MPDPLEALRAPIVPIQPDSEFTASLRRRVMEAIDEPVDRVDRQEDEMKEQRRARFSRNGTNHGDVSYLTLALPDAGAAARFYSSVLGWTFDGGRLDNEPDQVDAVVPQVGFWPGANWTEGTRPGAIPSWRVDDLEESVAAVRAAGGTAEDPVELAYGLQSACSDGRGLRFWLHQLAPGGDPAPPNGDQPGDVSYLALRVSDLARGRAFFSAVLGWSYTATAAGVQVEKCVPMTGISQGEPGLAMCYRSVDIFDAVEKVNAAGGGAGTVEAREYGRESLCRDNQGVAFYLHELI